MPTITKKEIEEYRQMCYDKNNGRILLFDVDDTLVHTTARIGIIKNGIVTKKISSKNFSKLC